MLEAEEKPILERGDRPKSAVRIAWSFLLQSGCSRTLSKGVIDRYRWTKFRKDSLGRSDVAEGRAEEVQEESIASNLGTNSRSGVRCIPTGRY